MTRNLLLTCAEYPPSRLLTDPATASRIAGLDIYALEQTGLENYTGLLIPIHADQRFLVTVRDKLECFLGAGGTLVLCGHIAYPFLPELAPFVPLTYKSVDDYRVYRVSEHPIFAGVDPDDLTFRKGVAGFYGRGHNPPPPGARILHRLGSPNGAPVDYIYRRPGGGRVLVHGGNNLWGLYLDDDGSSTRHIESRLLDWIESPLNAEESRCSISQ